MLIPADGRSELALASLPTDQFEPEMSPFDNLQELTILKCSVRSFQEQSLLRIGRCRFVRRKAEETSVEGAKVSLKKASLHRPVLRENDVTMRFGTNGYSISLTSPLVKGLIPRELNRCGGNSETAHSPAIIKFQNDSSESAPGISNEKPIIAISSEYRFRPF